MNTTELAFVNIHGDAVDTNKRIPLPKRASNAPAEFHKGFAVEGIPPGALEDAREAHNCERATALREGAKRIPEEWNELTWLAKAKAKRVRTKAYEVPEAAMLCKEMAEKAGWLRVTVRPLSKGSA